MSQCDLIYIKLRCLESRKNVQVDVILKAKCYVLELLTIENDLVLNVPLAPVHRELFEEKEMSFDITSLTVYAAVGLQYMSIIHANTCIWV